MSRYVWLPGMGEISGFGGSYEQACRTMLFAGLAWLDEHPDAKPEFRENSRIFGIVDEANKDAKALSAVVSETEPNCTGAMHHAVIHALMFIRKNGWDTFVVQMSAREQKGN